MKPTPNQGSAAPGGPTLDSPATTRLTFDQQRVLLGLARDSIDHGLNYGRALAPDLENFAPPLTEPRATFVTLHRRGQLRGCIGALEAHRPLALDVAHNAYAAAFMDPRFPPLDASERDDLDIHISVLTPATPLSFSSEEDLVRQLQPGIDGLILEEGPHRGTFLPSVWESLTDPYDFLRHLKAKAGLPSGYWSPTLRVARYRTESFS